MIDIPYWFVAEMRPCPCEDMEKVDNRIVIELDDTQELIWFHASCFEKMRRQ